MCCLPRGSPRRPRDARLHRRGGALDLPAAALIADSFDWRVLFWTSATLDVVAAALVDHLMQAWHSVDVLHVAAAQWNHRAGIGPRGARGYEQTVTVYSNAARVELFHKGRSLGTKPTDTIGYVAWTAPFVDGDNKLTARAITPAGKRLTDRATVRFTYHAPQLADPEVPFRRRVRALPTGLLRPR